MNKQFFIFLFTLLFLTTVVSAQPPFQDVTFTEGWTIKYPQDQEFKRTQGYMFHIHIYNSSDGLPVTEDWTNGGLPSCTFHLYDNNGSHIYIAEDNTTENGFDYEFEVDGGNFTEHGDYNYIVQCNNTKFGGFENIGFIVSETGIEHMEADLGMIYSLLMLTLLCLGIAITFPARHWILKTFFYFISLLSILLSINASHLIMRDDEGLHLMSVSGLTISIVLILFFLLYIFIYATIEIIKALKEKRGVRWDYDQ